MGFPHVLQLARIERIRAHVSGKQEVETVWVVTSLSPDQADAARLLALARQYWSIENGLHYRLDVSGAEDRCPSETPGGCNGLGYHPPSPAGGIQSLGSSPASSPRQHLPCL